MVSDRAMQSPSRDVLQEYSISSELGRSMMDAMEWVGDRTGRLPSGRVMHKALIGLPLEPHGPLPAIAYRVESASRLGVRHLVNLYLDRAQRRPLERLLRRSPMARRVVGAECSCEATTTCWHVLYALARARAGGCELCSEQSTYLQEEAAIR